MFLHCLWGEGELNAIEILRISLKSLAKIEDSKILTENSNMAHGTF